MARALSDDLVGARPLARWFYDCEPRTLARKLLGRILVHDDARGARCAGIIVETEAYAGETDPASHAWRGMTPRNRVMFGPPGHAYVYFTYGMHHCLNVVCGREGSARAVLLRALEPVTGQARMARRRGTADPLWLTSGPGMLAQALGLDLRHDGVDLTRGPLWIADGHVIRRGLGVVRGPRIGIRRAIEWPWRYWLELHPCVSRGGGPPGPGQSRRRELR